MKRRAPASQPASNDTILILMMQIRAQLRSARLSLSLFSSLSAGPLATKLEPTTKLSAHACWPCSSARKPQRSSLAAAAAAASSSSANRGRLCRARFPLEAGGLRVCLRVCGWSCFKWRWAASLQLALSLSLSLSSRANRMIQTSGSRVARKTRLLWSRQTICQLAA